ncbi:MAG: MFS transporter [Rhizomicrobium sp.]
MGLFMFSARRNALVFWIGCAAVTAGVVLHLPMFLMAKDMGFVLAGMPMDPGMLWGMALIVAGIGFAAYGLVPREASAHALLPHQKIMAPEDAPLTLAHWLAAIALAMALVIDIMKPASLGLVTPGMRVEYNVSKAVVAFLPFSALIGTALGSFIWGALADIYGRRATILLSAVMFIGTSICGAMPSLWWNVFMCFLMGLSAGGMLPVAYALLAEIMPTKYRGLSLVIVGGIGAVGGYLAASGLASLLQPIFGWRIMWFLNMPTGLMLIGLSAFIPESARFLMHIGQTREAYAVLARFGSVIATQSEDWDEEARQDHSHLPPADRRYLGTTIALTLVALSWGFVNFGLLLWLPSELIAEGRDMGAAGKIIAQSSLIAAPVVVLAAFLYTRWSTRGSLIVMIGITVLGMLAVMLRQSGLPAVSNPLVPITLLILGSTGVISILLPYAAENYPVRVRGRATGWVAGCSKTGGLICQGLSVAAAVPTLGAAALLIAVPTILGLALVAFYGRETRGRDLRELESPVSAAQTP